MKAYKNLAIITMLTLAGCGNPEDTVSKFIDSGNEYFEAGQYNKARVEYKNALQIDPRQAEPYYKLALIAEEKQNWKGVFNNLTVVEQLEPEHVDALLKIGKIYVLSGEYEEGLKRAEKVLSLDPDNLTAKVLKASIFTKQEDYPEAEKLISEVLNKEPDNFDALTLEIASLKQQEKHDEAVQKLDEALTKYPDDTALNLIKLQLLEEEKNYTEIAKIYKKLLPNQPDKWEIIASYARLQAVELDNFAEASSVVQSFIERHPKHTESKLMLISLLNSKDKDSAQAKLAEFIEQTPNNFELRFLQVGMLDKEEDVKAALEKIVVDDGQGKSANKAKIALANIAASKEDYATSKRLVSEVLAIKPDHPEALLLNAKYLIKDGKLDEAITDLRTAITQKPDLDEAYVYLSQVYVQTGSPELAEKTIREALDINPYNPQVAVIVASQLVNDRELDRAEEILAKAYSKNPENTSLIESLTRVRILRNDWVAGQETIDDLKSSAGDTVLTHVLSGELLYSQKNYAAALEEFKAALAVEPNMIRPMQGLANSYKRLEQPEAFIEYLRGFIKQNPTVLMAYQGLADAYSLTEQWDLAIQTLMQALDSNPDWVAGYNSLAGVHKRRGNIDKQIETYRKGAATNPDSLELKMLLASALEGDGRYEEAVKYYEQVLAINPNASIAINNLASILTDRLGSKEDLQRALEISSVFIDSTEPYFLDTYAWVNVKLGEYAKAEPILKTAVLAAPDVPIISYHLAVLYQKMGKEIEAERQFKKTRELAYEKGDTDVIELLKSIGK